MEFIVTFCLTGILIFLINITIILERIEKKLSR
jgi:hypothetical protein